MKFVIKKNNYCLEIFDLRKKNIEYYCKYLEPNEIEQLDKYTDQKQKKIFIISKYLQKNIKTKYYSISHTYPYCVIVKSNNEIGVDIEKIKNIKWKIISKRFFNIQEQKQCTNLTEFYKIWTHKEALYKMLDKFQNKLNIFKLPFGEYKEDIKFINKNKFIITIIWK